MKNATSNNKNLGLKSTRTLYDANNNTFHLCTIKKHKLETNF